jgi:ribonuclease R
MPLRFTHRILEHLAHARYRPSTPKELAHDLAVEPDERDLFEEAVAQLVEDGRLEMGDDGRARLPEYGAEVVGTFRLNARGFGFVIPDVPMRDGDLFVPQGRTRDAISGDRVRAAVRKQSWRGKARPGRSPYTGEIIEVLERGREHFVGVLFERGGMWFVDPGGRSLHEPVLIRDPHAKNAKAGDQVVIELLHYPQDNYVPEGVITRVLGTAGEPDVETESVIVAHGLRSEFPDTVQKAATAAARSFKAAGSGREDLTGTHTITIDPPDARDFDDAITLAHDEEADQWTLGVHIADVAHFVRPGSALDEEARLRGNSVYLPRLVIPMLPEALSNGVCSLQEGVERLTKSVFVTFGARGRVLDQRVAATVIRSDKRLTYLEAQALIDGDVQLARKHARTEPRYSDELVETLRRCDRLARVLRKRRVRDGMIVLNLPQVELVFDDQGRVTDAVPEDDAFTHTIIEMFMVEANEAIARTFDTLGVPVLRRIHPDPVPGDIAELRMYARGLGLRLPDEPDRRDLQRLLDISRDRPASRAIHFGVLRTLATASYSPALIGHFALASEHYAHFTSPIRRYPDLSVHRALEAYLDATENGRRAPGGRKRRELGRRMASDDRVLDEGRLVELGRHCTETEDEAEAAERQLREFLVLQFLEANHLGDTFRGVVTGIAGRGVFVSIERFLVEGLVEHGSLPRPGGKDIRWQADEWGGRLSAGRNGPAIAIGDIVTVQIARVDPASRHLDLRVTELAERLETPVTAGAPRKERGGRRTEGKRKGYKQGRRGRRGR